MVIDKDVTPVPRRGTSGTLTGFAVNGKGVLVPSSTASSSRFLSVSDLAMSPRVVHGKGSHARDGIRGGLAIFSRRMGEPLVDAMTRVPIVYSLMRGRLFVRGLQDRLFVGWCEHRGRDRRYGWGWRYDGGAWRG